MKLKPETIETIEKVIPRYPQKRSAVMPLLHHIQADQGVISNEAVEWVAEKLEMQPINVLEVVTFFPYFRQEKLGNDPCAGLPDPVLRPDGCLQGGARTSRRPSTARSGRPGPTARLPWNTPNAWPAAGPGRLP